MLKLSRYIAQEVGKSFLFTLSLLIAVIWAVQSLKYIGLILKSQESLAVFYHLILMTLPDLLVIILPISLFLSLIFVYNRLQVDRELVSFSAQGYSPSALAAPALAVAALLTGAVYGITLFVLPWSSKNMRALESEIKNSLPNILVQEGVFNVFNNVTVYVNKKNGHNLEGVLVAIQKPGEDMYTIMATEGRLVMEDRIPRLIMLNGNRQEYNPLEKKLSVLYYDKTIVSLSEGHKLEARRSRKPTEFNIKELLYAAHPTESLAFRQRLYAEGYQRLLSPWNCLVLASLALVFMLKSPFRRGTNSWPAGQATLCAILFQISTLALLNYGARAWGGIIAAYALTAGTLALCWYVLMHTAPPPRPFKKPRRRHEP